LASGSFDKTALLWNVRDPAHPQRLGSPLTGHTGFVYTVAFSPDGQTLATGSGDNTVILWDLRDPARPQRLGPALTGHTNWVSSASFSPDGQTLAGGSGDDSAILWDLSSLLYTRDHAAEIACARSGGGFDQTQWSHAISNLAYEPACDTS
jgi:WD40 repeat protein